MSELITIDKEIRLKKPIGGFHYLFVRASFVPYYKGSEVFDLNFGRIKKLDPKSISYRCEMSCGLSDASRTATELVTFDDCDDLEFSDFYRAALSSWKRKLSKSLA